MVLENVSRQGGGKNFCIWMMDHYQPVKLSLGINGWVRQVSSQDFINKHTNKTIHAQTGFELDPTECKTASAQSVEHNSLTVELIVWLSADRTTPTYRPVFDMNNHLLL